MKKIECIILPFKLAEIKGALRRVGIRDMNVSREFERNRGHLELYRLTGYPMEIDPKLLYRVNRDPMEVDARLKVEIVVEEENVDKVVEAIKQAVAAGKTV